MKTVISTAFARVGELACQQDSFLREITARVVSCKAAAVNRNNSGASGKKSKSSGTQVELPQSYDVILTDSVLFPDGGGQPCDHGVLIRRETNEELPVRVVQRRGDLCVMNLPCMLKVGEDVQLRVDWDRRLDHMQHHSAQHLLTAVVEDPGFCGLPTVSWALTQPYCHIVLPTGKRIEPEMVQRIEEHCNRVIARAVPVRCRVYSSKEEYENDLQREPEKNDDGGRLRGSRPIPPDVAGPIRIIDMEGIDCCTCCGTHVTNLAQLQVLKLLHQETKGDTLKLFFIAGERVRRFFGDMYGRERELMKEMGGIRPEDFVSAAIRKGKDFVELEKRLKHMTQELMKLRSEKLIAEAKQLSENGKGDSASHRPPVVVYRRDDVDADFFSGLRDELRQACPNCVGVFAWAMAPLTAAKTGQFMIVGPTESVEVLAPVVCAALEGKGGMSKFGYRGKGSLCAWEDLVKELTSKG
ncbi:tRNA synthetases class II (A) [Trypanosoma brucei equiperdum]|uniref:tRNA synthetases class II (A) n=1 Tax=Trypanosoma brucei equiperdum TaxID=630700 RepID=A0A3L6L7K3_9TRYP|nr:tRNA synthetases class II (A) [Trypanosoma brucei equiperdum]